MVVAEIEAMDQARLVDLFHQLQDDMRRGLGDIFQGDERAFAVLQQGLKKCCGAVQPLRKLLAVINGIVIEMHDHQQAFPGRRPYP